MIKNALYFATVTATAAWFLGQEASPDTCLTGMPVLAGFTHALAFGSLIVAITETVLAYVNYLRLSGCIDRGVESMSGLKSQITRSAPASASRSARSRASTWLVPLVEKL